MTPMSAVVLVVMFLAVYRLTLLVTADELTEPLREWVIDRFTVVHHRKVREVIDPTNRAVEWECSCGDTWDGRQSGADGMVEWNAHLQIAPKRKNEKLEVLITCPWCSSVWIAFPAVAMTLAWSDGWGWWLVAGALAASAVAGAGAVAAKPGDH